MLRRLAVGFGTTLTFVVGVPALAYVTGPSSGSGTALVPAAALRVTVLPSGVLTPGASTPITVELGNPEHETFAVRSVVAAASGERDRDTCPAAAVSVDLRSPPESVPPQGKRTIKGEVRLSPDAPDWCRGAHVALDVQVQGGWTA